MTANSPKEDGNGRDQRFGAAGGLLRQPRLRLSRLFVGSGAPAERRVLLTDGFGQRIRRSAGRFTSLVAEAKAGKPDGVATA
ncbi:hypothetical protein [Streptomyces hirsutus]|uniref:hypothetical protein n=1 Tax=Streptomyces hirsutus TaxID=35620 RepID=UPI000A6348A6